MLCLQSNSLNHRPVLSPTDHHNNNPAVVSMDRPKYQVFLGGSCNPTTWRTEIAVPFLTGRGISFYNPQCNEWTPDLLVQEKEAKDTADILFFVLGNETRSTSAMLEVAFALGRGQSIVLVINQFTRHDSIICGEKISQKEKEVLANCQSWLKNLARRKGIHVHEDIREALEDAASFLLNKRTVPQHHPQQLTATHHQQFQQQQQQQQQLLQQSQQHHQSSRTMSPRLTPVSQYTTSSSLQEDGKIARLFIISCNQPSLSEMIRAAFSLGQKECCVICIRELAMDVVHKDGSLTPTAVRDYNRARHYLRDLAKSDGIPVYTCLTDAVDKYLQLSLTTKSSGRI